MLVLLYRGNVCFDDQCMMLRENVPYDIQNCATFSSLVTIQKRNEVMLRGYAKYYGKVI